MAINPADLPYRPCAGFMLVNREGLVFTGQRIDPRAHGAWQMPQGGIDPGEDEETAALRELEEETGITPDKVKVLARSATAHRYDLPPELLGKVWKGKYRGQEQYWFLGRFLGEEADINLEAHAPPEFNAYRWLSLDELPERIVSFKREVYAALVAEFRELI
ncbi:MAG: RNA pyrophosphohydrolase [Erythrobacter sp.]|uniref:RNA pyrophosphohydrolase n=1 Tax=Erythrobacter sp. TaxID=1042 RepID=UPI0026155C0A|nr:RNA pyrophosphohydrolase [Erythrobacter sp.]MDJ0977891.1 RNA pyrophosphohydrolase [Erythrobacter sp.]